MKHRYRYRPTAGPAYPEFWELTTVPRWWERWYTPQMLECAIPDNVLKVCTTCGSAAVGNEIVCRAQYGCETVRSFCNFIRADRKA